MTPTDEQPALLPCPFCGGRASILRSYQEHDEGTYYSYACQGCRAQTGEKYARDTCPIFYAELREAWNTRAVMQPTVAQAAALADLKALATLLEFAAEPANGMRPDHAKTAETIRTALRALTETPEDG